MEQRVSEVAPGPTDALGLSPSSGEHRIAYVAGAACLVVFLVLVPFAKQPLAPMWAFIPIYQSALVMCDLLTAWLLYARFSFGGGRPLLLLGSAYVFTAAITVAHTLSFPGLFTPTGLLGAGPQTTAWLYMAWHAVFPLLIIGYVLSKRSTIAWPGARRGAAIAKSATLAALLAVGFALVAGPGRDLLPAIMAGNRYTPLMIGVVSTVWLLSAAALGALWWHRPHAALDRWLIVVMLAWICDVGLAAVFNGGRFDLGFYAGRIFGLLAASFVLGALLADSARLYARLSTSNLAERRERHRAERTLGRHEARLSILHEIDRGMAAAEPAEKIAAAVIRPLRDLLRVPRVIVNRFDLERGEVEWIAAAGRKHVRLGPGVRYSISMMGDIEALRRGEVQRIDTRSLPSGPEVEALLASGVETYLVVPMIASDELLGAISFGGAGAGFPDEQEAIAREVAAQLAIATVQTRLLARVRLQAAELEARVARRTAQLDAAKRQLEDLYDRAPCGYHSVDATGKVVRINDTWLAWLGYTRDEVVGRMTHADLMTPQSAQRFWEEAFPRFRRDGVLDGVEFEYRRKDGSTFVGLLNATSVYDAQGRYLMSRSTVFDVSARKRAEERLAALNKELESFSYSVSHDLRAPLRAIDGYARMLEDESATQLGEEGKRLLGVVRSSARRMGRLIDDLLEFSRLGQLQIARTTVDMETLAREVAAECAREHPRATVDIGSLPAALVDRALLRQVWVNLIGNACKYSSQREAPHVEVSGRLEGAEFIYAVRDNGVGFDMRYAGKLFAVFQRLHRQEEFAGTGVGLAIVHRIVTRHGGRVWAQGAPGEGATFFFALPKA